VGNPEGAVEAYRRYLEQEGVVAGAIHLRIGRLLLEAGDLEGALTAFEQAVATAPDNLVLFAAREELADLNAGQGDVEAAVAQFDQILAASESDRYQAEIQYRAGQVLQDAGQAEAAMARYRQAIREAESSPDALRAANALAALGQPLADEAYARLLLANGYHADGVAIMYRYLDAVPDHPAQPHLLVAESYFGRREYAQALAEWQTLLDTHPEYTDRAGVLIRMAVAHQRLGNTGAARDLYKQAAATSTARAPAALLEAARVAERSDDCVTAAAEYLDIARLYPAAPESGEALYRGAICQYRLGQVASAAETAQRLVVDYPTNTYAHAGRFWAGKALLERGEEALAAELWSGLRAEAPDSYYTARAAQLAQEAGLVSTGNQLEQPAGAPGTGEAREAERLMAETDQWLAGWAAPGVDDPAALRQLPAAVAGDPQLRRGEAYLRLGLRAEAIREFDEVRERYKDDPLALYPLALYFRDLGMYRHATLAAVRLGALAPGGLFEAPLAIQRMAYPRYFANLVEAEAAARGIDPLLIHALIRQESFFERGALSSAAAQGLTQVIPSTAEWIADAIDWPSFQPTDIYKPYINVKFGTYYLSAALDMFGGDPYPALVGYNAGPGNARAWLDRAATDDDDLYVEEITLNEPKLYVRRVLAHYANYRRLYPEG
jgi:soluble lytic murein transglycosylase